MAQSASALPTIFILELFLGNAPTRASLPVRRKLRGGFGTGLCAAGGADAGALCLGHGLSESFPRAGPTRNCPAQAGGVGVSALAPGPARGYYRKNSAKERFLYAILEELFTGTFGGVFIMVLVSAAVIILLRSLYGPRGVFRDPKWDESNKRIRLKEAEERERRLKEWQKRGEQDGD